MELCASAAVLLEELQESAQRYNVRALVKGDALIPARAESARKGKEVSIEITLI
jgi:hypothetical protein